MEDFKFRNANKQTADVLCWAFVWRFLVITIPLFLVLDYYFYNENAFTVYQIIYTTISLIINFGLCAGVFYYLQEKGFRNHKIFYFDKKDIRAYQAMSTANRDRQGKPQPVSQDIITVLKLSWAFYWRAVLYTVIFLIAAIIVFFIIALALAVFFAMLNIDVSETVKQTFGFVISVLKYCLLFYVYSFSFKAILENGFFDYFIKIAKVDLDNVDVSNITYGLNAQKKNK